MKIAIIKYNAGNVQSVLYALERLGNNAIVTDDVDEINSADKVIFPGVGEASTAMAYLRERKLDAVIKNLQQPVLGVCLGMQLMCAHSEENDTTCLGIFDEPVKRFSIVQENSTAEEFNPGVKDITSVRPPSPWNGEGPGVRTKIPQIGWNKIYDVKGELMEGVNEGYCYFVHSYYAALGNHTIATANYIQPYSAALHKNNFYGVQFHPEKSAETGEQILKNFLQL
jgi:imidazole glycerol-phosphate synthase subunit HisH